MVLNLQLLETKEKTQKNCFLKHLCHILLKPKPEQQLERLTMKEKRLRWLAKSILAQGIGGQTQILW